jgi:hypothetical protein
VGNNYNARFFPFFLILWVDPSSRTPADLKGRNAPRSTPQGRTPGQEKLQKGKKFLSIS